MRRSSGGGSRVWAIVVAALMVTACGGAATESEPSEPPSPTAEATPEETAEPTPEETAEPTASPTVEGTPRSVFDLAIGDCYDLSDEVDVEEVLLLDCEQPHDYEVYALVQHPAGPDDEYPGDQAISDFADTECLGDTFEAYVGRTYNDSELYAFTLQPTAETWDVGDREVVCSAFVPDEKLEGSVEGSGR